MKENINKNLDDRRTKEVLESKKRYKRDNKKKAVKLRDRSLTRFEVINLFEDVLNSDEREVLSTIIKILGIYMLLETNQLFQIYERITRQKLKLKFIKKAVKYNLIAEYQYDSVVDGEKEVYYYSAKLSGRIFLNQIDSKHNDVPLDADVALRQRILALNEFLIMKRYIMLPGQALSHKNGIYEVKGTKNEKIICFFPEISDYRCVIYFMVNYENRNKGGDDNKATKEDVLMKYEFEIIEDNKKYYFGNLTIATPNIYIDESEIE